MSARWPDHCAERPSWKPAGVVVLSLVGRTARRDDLWHVTADPRQPGPEMCRRLRRSMATRCCTAMRASSLIRQTSAEVARRREALLAADFLIWWPRMAQAGWWATAPAVRTVRAPVTASRWRIRSMSRRSARPGHRTRTVAKVDRPLRRGGIPVDGGSDRRFGEPGIDPAA